MLSRFFQHRYSTVLSEKSNSLLPSCTLLKNGDLLDFCVTVQYKKKRDFFYSQHILYIYISLY